HPPVPPFTTEAVPHEVLRPRTARNAIVATIEDVVARSAVEPVSAGRIISRSPDQHIVAADQPVVAVPAVQSVTEGERRSPAISGVQGIVASLQYVVPAKADQEVPVHVVVAGTAVDDVVPSRQVVVAIRAHDVVALEVVVAGAAVDDVVAGTTAHLVIPVSGVDHIISAEARNDIVPRGPVDHVVALRS